MQWIYTLFCSVFPMALYWNSVIVLEKSGKFALKDKFYHVSFQQRKQNEKKKLYKWTWARNKIIQ